jgi:GntR family transcriptional regulator/MocR family aminotransferase
LTIDRNSRIPLHRQIAAALRLAIQTGEITGGARLPSTRALAKRLAVSRNTVLTAYDELAADAVVTGRRGSGTRATGHLPAGLQVPVVPDPRAILRAGHYPFEMASFADPEGNPLAAVRTV